MEDSYFTPESNPDATNRTDWGRVENRDFHFETPIAPPKETTPSGGSDDE